MLNHRLLRIEILLVDLHTHTDASDGALKPCDLLRQAGDAGIALLSITDHDTVAAYRDLKQPSYVTPHLVPGIEFSTEWNGIGVHVLGLNIDPDSDAIRAGAASQQVARRERAERIGEKLERIGIPDALAGALAIAGPSVIGRPHFARFLVDTAIVRDTAQAFKKYLGAGKVGDVKQCWASLTQVIDWIRDGGGIAVLAHPGKYRLTPTKRLRLIENFRHLGGQGMEVISGRQDPLLTQTLAAAATTFNLLAACGSDFHRPDQRWAQLGMPLDLPAQCRPVWDAW